MGSSNDSTPIQRIEFLEAVVGERREDRVPEVEEEIEFTFGIHLNEVSTEYYIGEGSEYLVIRSPYPSQVRDVLNTDEQEGWEVDISRNNITFEKESNLL